MKFRLGIVEIQTTCQLKTQMYLKLSDEHFLLSCISLYPLIIIVHLFSSKIVGLHQKKAKNI